MNIYILRIIFLLNFIVGGSSIYGAGKEISLADIYKLRSDKISKNRLHHGKKILMSRYGKNASAKVDGATDVANRMGCDANMKSAAKSSLGKKSKKKYAMVDSACELIQREK